MSGNNLKVINTGLDHCYINGLPIVEAEIDIDQIYKKVGRISSLAVQADPWFNNHTNAQKLFSESHGSGDRITRDFLEEGAKDLRPIFSPLQRLIPEGTYDTTSDEINELGLIANFDWNNPRPTSLFVNSIQVICTKGSGDIEFIVDASSLTTISFPQPASYTYRQNVRNNNIANNIQCVVSNASGDFEYEIKINTSEFNSIGWIKALTKSGDVYLPSVIDDINVSYLTGDFHWENVNGVKVNGATVKRNVGSAYVTISYNGIAGTEKFIDANTVGEDYFGISEDITSILVELRDATDDFNYDLVINTELPDTIPSPRFEFDSGWNPGKVIFRYQNMDTRTDKLNYTSETLKDIRVDPNIFDEVLKYLEDSLKNYILKELYEAIGYDKKAMEYLKKYEQSRSQAKFWVRSEKGLQTQYTYGV